MSEISPEASKLQEKFQERLQEHLFQRSKISLTHHSLAFGLGFIAFVWSFLLVYMPLTWFLFTNYALFFDSAKFNTVLALMSSRGMGVAFAVLCAVPLAILINLAKHNRIDDTSKESAEHLSDLIPTSGIFKDW
jgi:hypothetical protein